MNPIRWYVCCFVWGSMYVAGGVRAGEVDVGAPADSDPSAVFPLATGSVDGQVRGISPVSGEIPLADATVILFDPLTNQILQQVLTDPGGFYLKDSIAPAEYGLYATAAAFSPQAIAVVVDPNVSTTQDFLLAPVDPCPSCAFQDVTVTAGLENYVAGTGNGHGPGAVFADLDNDGYPDLYLMHAAGGGAASANELYLNTPGPGGTRTYLLAPLGVGADDPGNATGAVAADYDNDGDIDLYVLNFDQPNVLLQNQLAQTGMLQFLDVTASTDPTPGVADDQFGVGIAFFEGITLDNSLTAAWGDVDRDGNLDLYVGNHNGYFGDVVEGPFNIPGRRDVFYHNNGDGTFTDLTMQMGVPGYVSIDGLFQTSVQRFSSSNGVVFADFDNDRWPDLLVTNKVGGPPDRDMLYINLGHDAAGNWQGFSTVTYDLIPPFGYASGAAMGVDVADVDNDGDLDIYITDFSGSLGSPGQNDLWINQLVETGTLSFVLSGALPAVFSWGTNWQDFDNNGFVDLHVATSDSFRDFLYMNVGTGISESAIPFGIAQVRNSRGDPTADYNRDGWPDLFVTNIDGGTSVLYENNLASMQAIPNHYLVVKLIGNPFGAGPFHSARDAIGGRVRLTADLNGNGQLDPGETQLREVVSGHGNAASTSSLELEFGLGLADTATLEIDWPSGASTTMPQVLADQFLVVRESSPLSVPAVSSWGAIILALLMLTVASVILGDRRRSLHSVSRPVFDGA